MSLDNYEHKNHIYIYENENEFISFPEPEGLKISSNDFFLFILLLSNKEYKDVCRETHLYVEIFFVYVWFSKNYNSFIFFISSNRTIFGIEKNKQKEKHFEHSRSHTRAAPAIIYFPFFFSLSFSLYSFTLQRFIMSLF